MSTGGLSQPEWSPFSSQGQERHVDCFLSILGCSWCIHPILSQNWKHSGYWCFHEPNNSVIRWSSRLLHRILVSTGWHISLIQTSCWHQTKSSVLAWPGQGRPGQYRTCLLMSTGGLNPGDVSPCSLQCYGFCNKCSSWSHNFEHLVQVACWPLVSVC